MAFTFCTKCDFAWDEECARSWTVYRRCSLLFQWTQCGIGVHSRVYSWKDENGDDADVNHFYYNKYGSFSRNLNLGGLHLRGNIVCQWVVYGYIMFNEVANDYCRKSLRRILSNISDLYDLQIKNTYRYLPGFANMLFNNYCSLFSPKATQEPRQTF